MAPGGIVAAMRPSRMQLRSSNTHNTQAPGPAFAALSAVLLASAALLGAGCGHPASREECEVMFRRSAEIELRAQNITDPKVIAERTAAVQEARGKDLIDKCVGRRITDSALSCVQQATTPEQVDRCLE